MRDRVLSLVEDGWRGARECSLILSPHGIPVTHLIKGRLDPALRAAMRPAPHTVLLSVPRRWFPLWLWWLLIAQTLSGRLRWVLVDRARTARRLAWWCRMAGVMVVLVRETETGFELEIDQRPISLAETFGVDGPAAV